MVISHSVILGEYDTEDDPDCVDEVCADRIKTIGIKKLTFSFEYRPEQQHDILLIQLITPVEFTGKLL